jgi:hypothetical protein
MVMTTQTFKLYTWGACGSADLVEDRVDWGGYRPDWPALVTAAGMDPEDDEVVVGTLTEAWNGHPAGAAVVSGLTVAGFPFAVGTEASAAPTPE